MYHICQQITTRETSDFHLPAKPKNDKKTARLGKSPLQKDKIMTASACADQIVKAMENRDRLAVLSLRGKLGRWLKMIAPGWMDRVAAKAIREAR